MKRQLVASVLAAAALGLASIGLASPASATQTENFAQCSGDLGTINVASGEDLLITFDDCSRLGSNNLYPGSVALPPAAASVTINGATFSRGTSGNNWTITGTDGAAGPLPAGTYTVYFRLYDAAATPPANVFTGSFTVAVASPATSTSSVSSSGPASLIQQFGKPVTGSCDANQPDGLNWGGVPSGGWAESWAGWMNSGAGGPVCTRTLVYRGATVGWGIL